MKNINIRLITCFILRLFEAETSRAHITFLSYPAHAAKTCVGFLNKMYTHRVSCSTSFFNSFQFSKKDNWGATFPIEAEPWISISGLKNQLWTPWIFCSRNRWKAAICMIQHSFWKWLWALKFHKRQEKVSAELFKPYPSRIWWSAAILSFQTASSSETAR